MSRLTILAVPVLLAACSSMVGSPEPAPAAPAGTQAATSAAASPTSATTVAPSQTTDETVEPSLAPTSNAPTDAPAGSLEPTATSAVVFDQPWATAILTDVATGESFSLAQMAAEGKTVFVETMAIWCSNCRAQQREAVTAFSGLDPEKVAWVGLDIEASETANALARYRDQNEFPFRYAIADQALSRALATEFGDVVLSPPSVNLIILGTDGQVVHSLGHHSAAELMALAAEHGS